MLVISGWNNTTCHEKQDISPLAVVCAHFNWHKRRVNHFWRVVTRSWLSWHWQSPMLLLMALQTDGKMWSIPFWLHWIYANLSCIVLLVQWEMSHDDNDMAPWHFPPHLISVMTLSVTHPAGHRRESNLLFFTYATVSSCRAVGRKLLRHDPQRWVYIA